MCLCCPADLSPDTPQDLVIRPIVGSNGIGRARLRNRDDLLLYATACRGLWPFIPRNALSYPHGDIPMNAIHSWDLLVEPYIETGRWGCGALMLLNSVGCWVQTPVAAHGTAGQS